MQWLQDLSTSVFLSGVGGLGAGGFQVSSCLPTTSSAE